jgi:hypothetical protein
MVGCCDSKAAARWFESTSGALLEEAMVMSSRIRMGHTHVFVHHPGERWAETHYVCAICGFAAPKHIVPRDQVVVDPCRPWLLCTISEEDVCRPKDGPIYTSHGINVVVMILTAIGQLRQDDVGKRVYLVPTDDGTSTVVQVESDEQRDRRLATDSLIEETFNRR